jgi:metal-responsive CopG/Arc/MetJ family transcriptional regulator
VKDIAQNQHKFSMKVEISVTLSNELIQDIERFSQGYKNRSDFVETAVCSFIKQIVRNQQNASDLAVINRNVERLNAEMEDVLEYQFKS